MPELKKVITKFDEITCENCIYSMHDEAGVLICQHHASLHYMPPAYMFCTCGGWKSYFNGHHNIEEDISIMNYTMLLKIFDINGD